MQLITVIEANREWGGAGGRDGFAQSKTVRATSCNVQHKKRNLFFCSYSCYLLQKITLRATILWQTFSIKKLAPGLEIDALNFMLPLTKSFRKHFNNCFKKRLRLSIICTLKLECYHYMHKMHGATLGYQHMNKIPFSPHPPHPLDRHFILHFII